MFIFLNSLVCYSFTNAYHLTNNQYRNLYLESISSNQGKLNLPYNFKGKIILAKSNNFYNKTIDKRVYPEIVTYSPATVTINGLNINWKRYVECSCSINPYSSCNTNCNENQIIYNDIPTYNQNRKNLQLEIMIESPQISSNYTLNIQTQITTISYSGISSTTTSTYNQSILVKENLLSVKHYSVTNEINPLQNLILINESNSIGTDEIDTPTFNLSTDGSSSVIEFQSISEDFDIRNGTFSNPVGSTSTIIEKNKTSFKLLLNHPNSNLYNNGFYSSRFNPNTYTNSVTFDLNFKYLPPPIAFIHGLGSNSSVFGDMIKTIKENNNGKIQDYQISAVDYKISNTSGFYSNANVVPDGILNLITKVRNNKIAVGKVNIVGHSMGGILIRLYQQSSTYRNDINRIITINTPHSGSPWPEVLSDSDSTNQAVANFIIKHSDDFNGNGLALPDLSVNSPIIDNDLNGPNRLINKTPTHTISTYGTLQDLPLPLSLELIAKKYPISTAIVAIKSTTFINNLFENLNNDFAVSVASQQGGITQSSARTLINNQLHSSLSNIQVIYTVYNLLNGGVGSFSISGLNPPNLTYSNSAFNDKISNQNNLATNLQILSPTNQSIFKYGDIVNINVTAENLNELTLIWEYNADSVLALKTKNNTINFNFKIDNKYFNGVHDFLVIGKDLNGNSKLKGIKFSVEQCSNQYSVKSGNWNDPTVWSCGSLPFFSQDIHIKSGHKIILNSSMGIQKCRKLLIEHGAIFENTGNFFSSEP